MRLRSTGTVPLSLVRQARVGCCGDLAARTLVDNTVANLAMTRPETASWIVHDSADELKKRHLPEYLGSLRVGEQESRAFSIPPHQHHMACTHASSHAVRGTESPQHWIAIAAWHSAISERWRSADLSVYRARFQSWRCQATPGSPPRTDARCMTSVVRRVRVCA